MSDAKDAAAMLAALGKPFPAKAIQKRKGGGGQWFDYIATHTVIHRLNTATNGEWSFHIKSSEWRNDLLIAVGELTIPGLGTRSGYGVQKVSDRGGEDLVKGAASDALKKAATLFGVAADLYGPDFEAEPAPQDAQAPRNAPQPAKPILDTPTPANLDRERVMKRLHAVAKEGHFTHDDLHALIAAKGFASMTDAPEAVLVELGRKVANEPDTLRVWLSNRAQQQGELMPDLETVPNPERHTN